MLSIQENIPLAPHTVIKIGGPARYFVEVKNGEEIEEVFRFAAGQKLPFFVLGAGSNTLISDDGFPGLVIRVKNDTVRIEGENVFAGAGVMTPQLAATVARVGLSGLEWGVGIPGTVGGSVRGNSGCFGGETKDLLEYVIIFDLIQNTKYKIQNTDCKFAYRESVFKKHPEWIIIDAVFKLKKVDLSQAKNLFEEIKKKSEERIAEQPIGEKTMGSTFKGVTRNEANKAMLEHAGILAQRGENRRGFISAGFLIEEAGLKGYRVGGAMVSSKHANFIINTGSATATEMAHLITHIKDSVKKKFGILLEEEIQYIGF